MSNTKIAVVLGMPFLTLSNVNVEFSERNLIWRSYTLAEALLTTRLVKLIDKMVFANVASDENVEAFVVYVALLSRGSKMSINPAREDQITSLLTEEVIILVKYLDYTDVFSKNSAAELPERTDLNKHAIDLIEGKQPLYGPIHSLGPVELETLKTYIETNLANSFIQSSKSPAWAPILFVQKPDGSIWLCVYYRGLNNLTIKNRYPLPLIGESLDRLSRAKRFTQLNLTSAYHWVRIKEGDEWKTALRTPYGHLDYQVMSFGISNAPASFQGYINKILAEKLNIFVIVYLDDIFIYTEGPGQGYTEAICSVLQVLRKQGLFGNLKKYRFHKGEVRFLGYVVLAQGVRIEDKRMEAVKNWSEPKSVRDIQIFIRLANFYWRFIQDFSKIAPPPTSMLKNSRSTITKLGVTCDEVSGELGDEARVAKKPAESKKRKRAKSKFDYFSKKPEPSFLTPDAKKAFNYLRQAFTEASIFWHLDPECHIWIQSNASGYCIGGILSQLTDSG